MNDKKIISELTNEQIDDLLTYTLPYTEQNAGNIKALALGKITPQKKPFLLKPRQILIAAAMALMMTIGVGALYISTLSSTPPVEEEPAQEAGRIIHVPKEKVMIGDFLLDGVARVEEAGESSIYVWLRKAPAGVKSIKIFLDDETELPYIGMSQGSNTFSIYQFKSDNDTDTFRIRTRKGEEVTVILDDICEAKSDVIQLDDVSLAMIQLPGTGNVIMTEFTDEFSLGLSQYSANTQITAMFSLEAENGDTGSAFGWPELIGYRNSLFNSSFNPLSFYDVAIYSMDKKSITLNHIWVIHHFSTYHFLESPFDFSVPFIVPKEGETVNCNITLFDTEEIKFTIKSIKNENGKLICKTETKENMSNEYRSYVTVYFEMGTIEDEIYKRLGTYDTGVYPDQNPGIKSYRMRKDMKPGDKVAIRLETIGYFYRATDPAQNLGVINLK